MRCRKYHEMAHKAVRAAQRERARVEAERKKAQEVATAACEAHEKEFKEKTKVSDLTEPSSGHPKTTVNYLRQRIVEHYKRLAVGARNLLVEERQRLNDDL